MKLRRIFAGALALALSASAAFAQTNPGSSPLTPSKGGTNSAFVGFTGPASSVKTFTLPNASDTIATLGAIQTFTAAKTFNNATLLLAGSSSGTTTLNASATASGVLTLPAATDTLIAKATTDTLTNKTYDTAGTGNSFLINGLAATANTGTGSVVRATTPTLVTPVLGVATATSINKVAITAPATSSTITIPDGVTLTGPASSGTAMTLGNTETVTGVKTFGSAGAVGRLKVAGATSGSTILDATAAASGTLTLPAVTDTLIAKATTDTLTNKTFDTAGTGNSFSINGVAANANTGTGSVVRATSPTLSAPVFTGSMDNQGTLKHSAFVTSTQITAAQNNYTATDGSNTCTTKLTLRISSDASRNITGMSCAQAEGDIRIIHNVGAFSVVLTNEDAGSTAANRFLFGGDMTLLLNTSVTIRYDGVAARWRAITTPGAGGGGGGVTSVTIAAGNGISVSGTCVITTSGTCTVAGSHTTATNSLGADVTMNNTSNYFDGPSMAQGTTGTWLATGTVSLLDTAAMTVACKLWDGTTVIASAQTTTTASGFSDSISMSGVLASPAANIRISCKDVSTTTGKMIFNGSGNSKDSTITGVRIQ